MAETIARCGRSWWFGASLTVLGVVVGGLGSVYAEEIRAAWPFVGPPYRAVVIPALFFWGLLILLTLGIFARLRAIETARTRAEERLTSTAQNLEQLIRTQPPEDFLALFQDTFRTIEGSIDLAFETHPSRDKLERAIRHVLWSVLVLARKFDRAPKVRYGANIMIFNDVNALDRESADELRGRLRFVAEGVTIGGLTGVLDLVPALSTAVDADGGEPQADKELPKLALPVPHNRTAGSRSAALPGAPRTFLTGDVEFFADVGQIRTWCETKGDFSPSVCEEIGIYFAETSRVRSFVSLPLFKPGDAVRIGVLNLHRERVGILRDQRLAEQFAASAYPLLSILERLTARWIAAPRG